MTIGLVFVLLVGAGQARAQTAPADPAATAPTPADATAAPPPPAVAEANPLAESQLEQVRKAIAAAPKLFEFHGYVRSGTGINASGGTQVAFQAPGAFSKFRLGNETEVYGDFELDSNWINPDHSDTWFKTAIKLSILAPRNSTFDILGAIGIREAYGEAGHVVAAHPEMTFWAGQRYYRRRDVHISDFFFNDTSGYGGGFQDLAVGDKTKLSIAYLGGSAPLAMGELPDLGKLIKNTIDIRLSDIPLGPGTVELLLLPTIEVGGTLPGGASPAGVHSGIGGGVFYNVPVLGGFNEVSGQVGFGGAANLTSNIDRSIASGGWLARLVDRAAVQLTPKISMMWSGVVQLDNRNGSAGGSGGNLWISLGARPIVMTSKYTGVAVEAGVDMVRPESTSPNPDGGTGLGVLGKLTVAGLVRPAADFWARPELRAFVTAAAWNTALKGAGGVGFDPNAQPSPNPFAGDNIGLTAGVQLESWW
jgi:maltoporin